MFQHHDILELPQDDLAVSENLERARAAYKEKQLNYLRHLGKAVRGGGEANMMNRGVKCIASENVKRALEKVHHTQEALLAARIGAGFEIPTNKVGK